MPILVLSAAYVGIAVLLAYFTVPPLVRNASYLLPRPTLGAPVRNLLAAKGDKKARAPRLREKKVLKVPDKRPDASMARTVEARTSTPLGTPARSSHHTYVPMFLSQTMSG